MDGIYYVMDYGLDPGRPVAHQSWVGLWVFAGRFFRPSGWLRPHQRTSIPSSALSSAARRKLIFHYNARGLDSRWPLLDAEATLGSMLRRHEVQAFRLPLHCDLHRVVSPDGYIVHASLARGWPGDAPWSDGAVRQARRTLAWELGEIVDCKRGVDLEDAGGDPLLRVARVEITAEYEDLVLSLHLASRADQPHYERAVHALHADPELRALIGGRDLHAAGAVERIARQGYEVLRQLADHHSSDQLLLREFLLPDSSYLTCGARVEALGLDTLLVLSLANDDSQWRAAQSAVAALTQVGPFNGEALYRLGELFRTVRLRQHHLQAVRAPVAEPALVPAVAAVAEAEAPEPAPELDLEPDPEPALDPTPEELVAARWTCRKSQIATAREKAAAMPISQQQDRLTMAADRFEQNMVAEQSALLSQQVYDAGETDPPPGWVDISQDEALLGQYGLETDLLENDDSGFRARMYAPDPAVFGEDLKPAVAFKGSSSREDWRNNAAQAFDRESDYYERAVEIGNRLHRSGKDVALTGHSLGGGLGAAAGRASGLPTITFNAAGLHDNTVARYGGTPIIPDPDNILAYRVKNDVVTGVQEPGWKTRGAMSVAGVALGGGVGGLLGLGAGEMMNRSLPRAPGVPHELPGRGNPVRRHRMAVVIAGIEQQNAEDQAELSEATGIHCA